MNDEYKAVIMMNLRDFDAGRTARHGTYDLEGKLAELERVYAKAEKANEYEAKAKAFDDGKDRIYSKISHIIMNTEPDKIMPGYVNGMYHALDLLNEDVPDD